MDEKPDQVKDQGEEAFGIGHGDEALEPEGKADRRPGEAKDVQEVFDGADGAAASEEGPLKRLADGQDNEMTE
jgi:hypothetical protein